MNKLDDPILNVSNLTKTYNNRMILEDVSFQINRGEIVGLIGKNGSGKTTLMKIMLGLTMADTGVLSFFGDSSYRENYSTLSQFGFLIDCKMFESLTGYENLILMQKYSGQKNSAEAHQLLKFVDLENNRKTVKSFSFGMKQRLALALALQGNPSVLILDEPFVGLDPIGIQLFSKYIRQLQKEQMKTVIISSHQLNEIQALCDRFLYIKEKQISEVSIETNAMLEIRLNRITPGLVKQFKERIQIDETTLLFPNDSGLLNEVIREITCEGLKIIHLTEKDNRLSQLFNNRAGQ